MLQVGRAAVPPWMPHQTDKRALVNMTMYESKPSMLAASGIPSTAPWIPLAGHGNHKEHTLRTTSNMVHEQTIGSNSKSSPGSARRLLLQALRAPLNNID